MTFPNGTDADIAGNTIGCRTYHANASGTDPVTHCKHAGPSGGTVCGGICEAYCNISMAACSGATYGFFSTYNQCYKTCLNYNSTGVYTGTVSGSSVECRVYHSTVALSDPATHCQHASPSGADGCGSRCVNYCYTMQKVCPVQYDPTYCAGNCAEMPVGNITDVGGNTIDCRIYHANNANISGDATHCIHATPSGGNVCGTWCAVYCQLASSVCTGALALYPNDTACMTACAAINSSGVPTGGASTGDTLQCRIYHIGAGPILGNTTLHCPHGLPVSAVCNSGSSSTTSSGSTSTSTTTTSTGSSSTTKTGSGVEALIVSSSLLLVALLF